MGGKCSARDPGPCHCLERTASSPADPGLRKLPPPRPDSRLPGEGHAEPAARRAEAVSQRYGDFLRTLGRPPSSLLLARSSVVGVGRLRLGHRRAVTGAQRTSIRRDGSPQRPEDRLEEPVAGGSSLALPGTLRRHGLANSAASRDSAAVPRYVTQHLAADPVLTTHNQVGTALDVQSVVATKPSRKSWGGTLRLAGEMCPT